MRAAGSSVLSCGPYSYQRNTEFISLCLWTRRKLRLSTISSTYLSLLLLLASFPPGLLWILSVLTSQSHFCSYVLPFLFILELESSCVSLVWLVYIFRQWLLYATELLLPYIVVVYVAGFSYTASNQTSLLSQTRMWHIWSGLCILHSQDVFAIPGKRSCHSHFRFLSVLLAGIFLLPPLWAPRVPMVSTFYVSFVRLCAYLKQFRLN